MGPCESKPASCNLCCPTLVDPSGAATEMTAAPGRAAARRQPLPAHPPHATAPQSMRLPREWGGGHGPVNSCYMLQPDKRPYPRALFFTGCAALLLVHPALALTSPSPPAPVAARFTAACRWLGTPGATWPRVTLGWRSARQGWSSHASSAPPTAGGLAPMPPTATRRRRQTQSCEDTEPMGFGRGAVQPVVS